MSQLKVSVPWESSSVPFDSWFRYSMIIDNNAEVNIEKWTSQPERREANVGRSIAQPGHMHPGMVLTPTYNFEYLLAIDNDEPEINYVYVYSEPTETFVLQDAYVQVPLTSIVMIISKNKGSNALSKCTMTVFSSMVYVSERARFNESLDNTIRYATLLKNLNYNLPLSAEHLNFCRRDLRV